MIPPVMLLPLFVLLLVSMRIFISVSADARRHRIGATLLPVWVILMLTYHGYAVGAHELQQIPASALRYQWPIGVMVTAWALWDVSRLARLHGTSTLQTAADIARGLLHSPRAQGALALAYFRSHPRALWISGPNGEMLLNSPGYGGKYGKDPMVYVGAANSDMWTESVSRAFEANNRAVWESGQPAIFMEPAPSLEDPNHVAPSLKFLIRDERGHPIAIGGEEVRHA